MRLLSLNVENYRTLEDVNFTFSEGYNAVCGKNNSGKSNLIRAVRLLFGEISNRFPFEEFVDFSYKSDMCAWKKSSEAKNQIRITGKIKVSRSSDQGIIEFIESIDESKTHLDKGLPDFEIVISIEANIDSSRMQAVTITINETEISDKVVSQGIYEKLKKCVVFHNSTMTQRVYFSRRRTLHGIFSKIPEGIKVRVDDKAKALKREMNKVFKEHANELQSMLGRLGDKLEVKLDTPEFDFEEYPYGISLGYKDFNIPLDDWGSGTRNQTLIIKTIFDAKTSSNTSSIAERVTPIVLIEEPESFLHPLAQAEFSEVLQGLANEWGIQVIATTHSPYLLSHRNPEANILLERPKEGRTKILGATVIVGVAGDNWKKPFEHALGVCGPEFDIFKKAIFSQSEILIMVEGEIDKEYLELCRNAIHGNSALLAKGEIFSYDGRDNIKNDVLLKFLRDRFTKVIITSDLDAEPHLKEKLGSIGFEKDQNYFTIGMNSAGKRDIEGLIPDRIVNLVNTENANLVHALRSDIKSEVKTAKNNLKKKYLEKFRVEATIENGDYGEFYKLCRKINSACS